MTRLARSVLAGSLGFLTPQALEAVSIDWADGGVASGDLTNPTFFIGPPDQGVTNTLEGPPPGSILAEYSGSTTAYDNGGLAAILGINTHTLLSGNFIAFDRNAGGGAFGFESSHWTFSDGTTTFEYSWVELSPPNGAVIAAGTIDGPNYSSYFGLPPLNFDVDWGYLLFNVPVDVRAAGFQVQMDAVPFDRGPDGISGTPNVDAMGALLPVPEPSALGLLALGIGLAILRRRPPASSGDRVRRIV